MSNLQDHFAAFLRDRSASDMVRSVYEDLFDGPHMGLIGAMEDGLGPYHQRIELAVMAGDREAVTLAVADMAMASIAIGAAFGQYELEKVLREETVP